MTLSGKTAFVTGAHGGIGRAIVTRFLREGAVGYAADLPGSGPPGTQEDGSRFVGVDVASEADVAAATAEVRERSGTPARAYPAHACPPRIPVRGLAEGGDLP